MVLKYVRLCPHKVLLLKIEYKKKNMNKDFEP